tara:strand:+ start:9062 stop:9967 length:906 start_codon:yes stop_codon:yes gene_type:complete
MENLSNQMSDASSAAKNFIKPNNEGMFEQFGNNNMVDGSTAFLNSNTLVAKVVFILLILILFIFLMRISIGILYTLFGPKENPILKSGRFSGKHQDKISVDPRVKLSKPILRSKNEDMGMEFTYSTWLYFEDENFNKSDSSPMPSHIFSKGGLGNTVASGILAGMAAQNGPGLYLDGGKNELVVVMQTYDDVGEVIRIPDIPIKKWLNVIIRLENRNLDVYINGTIVVRHELGNVPKQNYSDVHISRDGGFDGEQSSLRYFNRALTSMEIQNLVQKGPNMSSGGVSSPFPPYLSTRWFFSE